MSIEAMKQAIEALEQDIRMSGGWTSLGKNKAITSLRQAIAEAEKQEPPPECQTEAEKTAFAFGWWKAMETKRAVSETHKWVGLTYEEIDLLEELYAPPIHPDFVNDANHCLELIRHVEAKLKEKNT
jgi:hypothetical protein